MKPYSLAPGVGFCRFTDCTILLDTRQDRYWQLGPDAGALLARLESTDAQDDELLKPLLRLGAVVAGPAAARPAALRAPQRSLLEETSFSESHVIDTIEVGWHAVKAHAALRFRRLDLVLAKLSAPQVTTASVGLGNLASRFESARSLVPLAPRCLPDTIAWLAFMARRGHGARLVFGVRSSPFQAHCWAQIDDIVLNDALDHARRFSPILVI